MREMHFWLILTLVGAFMLFSGFIFVQVNDRGIMKQCVAASGSYIDGRCIQKGELSEPSLMLLLTKRTVN